MAGRPTAALVGAVAALRPLANRYPPAAAVVLLALCPFIVVTTAGTLLEQSLVKDLDTSTTALQTAGGLFTPGTPSGRWWRRCW